MPRRKQPRFGLPTSLALIAALALILAAPHITRAQEEPEEEVPYWYIPGHPDNPATAQDIQTLPGFTVQRLYTVPADQGSWTAITVDPKGRIITAAQHRPGLYRITPPPLDTAAQELTAQTQVEQLQQTDPAMGFSHGLLHAFNSLYVVLNEDSDGGAPKGIYRLQDTNNDDQYDTATQLIAFPNAGGEHGVHNIIPSPDGKTLTFIAGNGTPLPENFARNRAVTTEGYDHLMPPGFNSTSWTPGGWTATLNPDGSDLQLMARGLRNSFDIAYNQQGELFTFDSDMEWDLGTPWYRPTRIVNLVSGAEFGWRGDAGKWPEHYEDSVGPVLNVGPASPTGITFGYGTHFPAKYRQALFALDWTFATIHAIHLQPSGASYKAERETFVAARGLPLTDAVVNPHDGALYFIVGGRKLGSALYRVVYTGTESTEPLTSSPDQPAAAYMRNLRHQLEQFHGTQDPKAIETAWPYLSHADRSIRYAARLAVEHQPVDQWRSRALDETAGWSQLTALLALVRQGTEADLDAAARRAASIDFNPLDTTQQLALLRIHELHLARTSSSADQPPASSPHASAVIAQLDPYYPAADRRVNLELARILCLINSPSAAEKTIALMEAGTGRTTTAGAEWAKLNDKYGVAIQDMLDTSPQPDRMHYAMMLPAVTTGWTPDLRQRYFTLMAESMEYSNGGYQYRGFWERIRDNALEQIPSDDLREQLADISAGAPPVVDTANLPQPKGPGQNWDLPATLQAIGPGLRNRNFDNGKAMYSAATCIVCHRFAGQGGNVGPDLTTLGSRFSLTDIAQAVIDPNLAVSDQYQVVTVTKNDGSAATGRVLYRDSGDIHLMPNMLNPTDLITIPADQVASETPLPVSPMPPGLINRLNRNELLDLLAYLQSGGNPNHSAFNDQ